MIPKAGIKLRRRETATITDRVVQASLKLEPVSDLRKVRCARF
jgi:hypothetical protein